MVTTVMSHARIMWFTVFTLTMVFNYAETWYFGWHSGASCRAEAMCDIVCMVLVVVSIIGMWINK